jgi:hypothetical protein
MTSSTIFRAMSTVPIQLWMYFALAAMLVVSFLVFYALRTKDNVLAEFKHGSTTLKLEARGRQSGEKRQSLKPTGLP